MSPHDMWVDEIESMSIHVGTLSSTEPELGLRVYAYKVTYVKLIGGTSGTSRCRVE